MKIASKKCKHVWFEGTCEKCGTEYANTKREPGKPGFLPSFWYRIKVAFHTGVNPNWTATLSPNERKLELRRLAYNAARFENADRAAQIRRAQFDMSPVWGICLIGGLIFTFMISMVAYSMTQPKPKPEKIVIDGKSGKDSKWPDKCNPTIPGVRCTARDKKTKKPVTIIILPPRVCNQNEADDSPCYYEPIVDPVP